MSTTKNRFSAFIKIEKQIHKLDIIQGGKHLYSSWECEKTWTQHTIPWTTGGGNIKRLTKEQLQRLGFSLPNFEILEIIKNP